MSETRPRTACLARSALFVIGIFALNLPVATAELRGNTRVARDANGLSFDDDGPQSQTGSVRSELPRAHIFFPYISIHIPANCPFYPVYSGCIRTLCILEYTFATFLTITNDGIAR